MRYHVTVDGRTFEIEISGERITVDGTDASADLRRLGGTALRHLLLDGASHAFVAREGDTPGRWEIHLAARRFEADVLDERTRTIRSMSAASAAPRGPRAIRAPMPGLVVRLEVEEGEEVRGGQGIVIIEAMKMENELRADGGGVVARILVQAGQAVEKGAVLVEFEAGE
jgi:biotin carboxyl carrier protein